MALPAQVVKSIVEWIDDNLHHPLQIEDVALRSGYSKWHLQRLFIEHVGVNLGRYIRERRLAMAARDLRETVDKVCDISDRYGYESQQTFTRGFTRRYQVAPGEYRRRFGSFEK